MSGKEFLPEIEPIFEKYKDSVNYAFYANAIRNALDTILANRMSFANENGFERPTDQPGKFLSLLPIVTAAKSHEIPGEICFFSLSKCRPNAFKFFYDMITCWLLPGRRLNAVLIYAADFRIKEMGKEIFTLCEVVIRLEKRYELEQIIRNFQAIETELRLGIASSHYSRRILEVKGLSSDEKVALIQEYITYLMDRLPHQFDEDVLTEMQHVLVMCHEDFKKFRECRHLSRIIGIHYLFRKSLRKSISVAPGKRFLSLKLFKARLKFEKNKSKTILAVLVGVNFLRDKEMFEKMHLLKAIQNYIPFAQAIDNSFFASRRGSEHICTLYLEIEKSNGEEFSTKEIQLLRQELPIDLKDRIEHLMHPVFMPRNEEEIIRNILSLSSQIKYLRDIPQVFISFDEQTHNHLFFTIILVRVLKPEALSIQEMFKTSKTSLEYIHDRCQNAGSLRRKYKKEATVFRVKVSKDQFLRGDHSIDLNKARQSVVIELSQIIGEIRDFNGGMISKQNEVFCQLKSLLQNRIKYNDLLLENFFYSLTPVIMRNVMEPEALQTLFLLLLESIEESFFNGESCAIKILIQGQFAFVLIKTEERAMKDEISRALTRLQLHSSQLANSYVAVYDIIYLGYIYRSDDPHRQQQFCQVIKETTRVWELKKCPTLNS